MIDVVMTQDYGRYAQGQVVHFMNHIDAAFLVDKKRVAEYKDIFDARSEVESIDPDWEPNKSRVPITSLVESDVRALQKLKMPFRFQGGEFPIFNTCTTTFVDLQNVQDLSKENDLHTISIRLPNGDYLTVALVPYSGENGDGCVDIQYHGDKSTRVIGFKQGRNASIIDDPKMKFHTLVFETRQATALESD